MSDFGLHRISYNVGPTSGYTDPVLPGPGTYSPPVLPVSAPYPTFGGGFGGASIAPGITSLIASAALVGGLWLLIKKL